MATKYVQGVGNWSTVQWWTAPSGGSTTTTPTTGDTAESNNFTVTIDANVICDALQNTAGGGYSLTSGSRTITASIINTNTTTTFTISSTGTTTIVGNITGGSGVALNSTTTSATIIITGNVQGGSGTNSSAITGGFTLTITGNVTGGSGALTTSGIAVNNATASTITVTGTVTGGTSTAGGSAGPGISNNGSGTWIINGNVVGGSGSGTNMGIAISSTCNLTINGNAIGGSGTGTNSGLQAAGSGTVIITGTATGGMSIGTSVSSQGVLATAASTGPVTVQGGAIGGPSGNSSNVGVWGLGSGTVIVQTKLVYSITGMAPTAGKVFFNPTTASTVVPENSSAVAAIFVHPSATVVQPANSDVRSGVVFNSGGNTGTLSVPSPSSVVYGVLTDNTTGTAVLLMDGALPTSPAANSFGESFFFADIFVDRVGVAQAGSSTTITLDAGASSNTLAYIGDMIYLYGGTGGGIRGSGQYRTIVAYNSTTKVATVNRSWDTNPDSTTKFATIPQGLIRAATAM